MVTIHSPGCARAREFGDPLDNVVDRTQPRHRRQRLLQALAIHMRMGIDQARHGGTAVEIDDARLGANQRLHIGVGADRDNAIAAISPPPARYQCAG